ncbi:response regulator [Crocosphaera subtropica]|nr:response regulator [Crocosphaera subtropica]
MSSFNYTGQLIITREDITWTIDLERQNLKYASHSLQSIETLELCLYTLGYGEKTPTILKKINQSGFTEEKGKNFIQRATDWLIQEENLSLSQQINFINQLTQDALESFFEITTFSYYECEEKSYFFPSEQGFKVKDILNFWRTKQQTWQSFNSVIISPHQCINLTELPNLLHSQSSHLLTKLAHQQGKVSLRQLSILLKLEDWEVAELIYPHLQSGILQLDSPLPPFNQLPPFTLSYQSLKVNKPSNQIVKTEGIRHSHECKNIVCIDNDNSRLNTIRKYFNSENTNLYLVSEPHLALEQLFTIKPDLLLVDTNTSGINGYQFSKIIKKSSAFQHLPIIMMSAEEEKITAAQIEENVVNDFLSKHCSESELIRVIKKYLEL